MPVHDWTRVSAGTFHHFLCCWVPELSKALNRGILPADYCAMAEQTAGDTIPEVLTLRTAVADENAVHRPAGAIAVAEAPPKTMFSAEFEADVYAEKRRTLVIRHRSGDQIVALVEILSPGNKASRHALSRFADKVYTALKTGYHLLLVDLFPPGSFDPNGIHGVVAAEFGESGFKLPAEKRLTLAAYAVGETTRWYVDAVAVGDTLPDMPLFLTDDVYVPAPLEATYCEAWAALPRRWQEVLES